MGANSKCVINKALFYLDTSLVSRQVLFKIFTFYSCKKIFYSVESTKCFLSSSLFLALHPKDPKKNFPSFK